MSFAQLTDQGNRTVKLKSKTIVVVRAFRADGLLSIAVLELALPSTKTWRQKVQGIALQPNRKGSAQPERGRESGYVTWSSGRS